MRDFELRASTDEGSLPAPPSRCAVGSPDLQARNSQAGGSDAFGVRRYWPSVGPADREELDGVLLWDMASEYDARFLTTYLREIDVPLSKAFWARQRQWDLDEQRHHRGFLAVNEALFGRGEEALRRRRPDFAPLQHLFADEFAISCLFAYDELVTVRGYRVNLGLYDKLGAEFGAHVREVIADEGRHYGSFLELIRQRHAHRIDAAPDVVAAIRAAEGTPYAFTFVLDHDEDLYTDAFYDDAERVLLKHLASPRRAVVQGVG